MSDTCIHGKALWARCVECEGTQTQKPKLAVIVSDAVHMVNVGGELIRTVRLFELPDDIAAYIKKCNGSYTTLSLAIEDNSHD